MQIQKFVLGNLRSNAYIVFNETNCFVVDPGFENNLISSFIDDHGLTLDFIYITHGHYDHIGGVKQLKERYQPLVYAPIKDKYWLDEYAIQKLGFQTPVDQYFKEPFELQWQDLSLKFYDTPGHSEGGTVCYIDELGVLFSGDTLFFQTIGRTDIPYADYDTLVSSVKKLYKLLPNQTRVYSGHGRPTDILHEKKNNPFVNEKDM